MKKQVKTRKTKKALVGALIGAGVSVGMGLLNGGKAKKQAEQAALDARTLAAAQNKQEDNLQLENYQEQGVGSVDYYQAKGGIIDPIKKGKRIVNNATRKSHTVLIYDKTKKRYLTKNTDGKYFMIDGKDLETNTKYWRNKSGKEINAKDASYFLNSTKIFNSKFDTKGGKLKSISSDTVKAIGNKHNQSSIDNTSGIKLIKNGKPVVEVEGGEVIKNDKFVYSDKTKVSGNQTYADIATKLANKKKQIEQTSGDKVQIAGIDAQENALFAKQESKKTKTQRKAIPIGKFGIDLGNTTGLRKTLTGEARKASKLMEESNPFSKFIDSSFDFLGINKGLNKQVPTIKPVDIKSVTLDKPSINTTKPLIGVSTPKIPSNFSKGLNDALPFVDNIVNGLLTNNAPKVIKPHLQRNKNLKTTYNSNPELAAIKDASNSASTFIQNNTSSSANARNEIAAIKLNSAKATGKVLANKQNIETSLINQNIQNKQRVTANNLSKLDTYSNKAFTRNSDIQARISANVANVAGDIVDKRNFDATQSYNKERLDIARQDGVGGTTLRVDLNNPSEITKLQNNPAYATEQRKRYLNDPRELARFDELVNKGKRKLAVPTF